MRSFNFNNLDRIDLRGNLDDDLDDIFIFSELDEFILSCDKYEEIDIDLRKINWFNSALLSIFTSILRKGKEELGLNIKIISNEMVRKNLISSGFFNEDKSNYFNPNDIWDTHILVKKFQNKSENFDQFLNYIKYSFQDRHFTNTNLISLSELFAEIFSNFIDHSFSKYIHISGQFFPNKKYTDVCLTDKGIGIVNLIKRERSIERSDEAIKWAFLEKNTTRDKTGGLGLKKIKNFIENKNGYLIVYCNNVCYNVIKDECKIYKKEFFGTSIFIRLPM